MRVRDVCAVMEAWAPEALAFSWDRVGLRIGDPDNAVGGVLTALSVTRGAMFAAGEAGANLIVSHHPFPFAPLETINPKDPDTQLCLGLVQSGVSCYAAHTNLDVAPGGVNHVLAAQLGIEDAAPLLPVEQAAQVKLSAFVQEEHLAQVCACVREAAASAFGRHAYCSVTTASSISPGGPSGVEPGERRFEAVVLEAILPRVLQALREAFPDEPVNYEAQPLKSRDSTVGLGAVGELAKPLKANAFARHVREQLGISHARLVGEGERKVQRVAVIGGSGGGEIERMPEDVDLLVTGDVKYHQAQFAADRGLAVIDAGHYGTEIGIAEGIAAYLRRELDGLPVTTYTESDPFRPVQE
ncbi:MAG: Nif3-like dinuclear metal center hexameric protein [Candidatus Hydrogenedentota bacterium]